MLSSPDRKLTLVTNHQVSLQCVSLQCPTTKYICSAQPPSIPAVPNHQVSLQCPAAEYPRSAQPAISLQCPSAEFPWSAQQQSINILAVLQGRQLRGGREKLHFLCDNGFRVGMSEVKNFKAQARAPQLGSTFALWPGVSVVPTGQSTSIGRMHGCWEKHGV